MSSVLQNKQESPFEVIKHIDEQGNEYWLARELMELVEYSTWQHFKKPIDKAIVSLRTFGINPENHITQVRKQFRDDNNCLRTLEDFRFSRHGCNIVFQNCDSSKPRIAEAQAYYSLLDLMKKQPTPPKDELDILEGAIKVLKEVRTEAREAKQLALETKEIAKGNKKDVTLLEHKQETLENSLCMDEYECGYIYKKVHEICSISGYSFRHIWSTFNSRFGIAKYRMLPKKRFREAKEFIDNWHQNCSRSNTIPVEDDLLNEQFVGDPNA